MRSTRPHRAGGEGRETPHREVDGICGNAVCMPSQELKSDPGGMDHGIAFMTAVGKILRRRGMEFILLSIRFVPCSGAVHGLHDSTAMEKNAPYSLLGPVFLPRCPQQRLWAGSQIAKTVTPGAKLVLYCRVTTSNGCRPSNRFDFLASGANESSTTFRNRASIDSRACSPRFGCLFWWRTGNRSDTPIPMDARGRNESWHISACMRPAHIHSWSSLRFIELVTALYLRRRSAPCRYVRFSALRMTLAGGIKAERIRVGP